MKRFDAAWLALSWVIMAFSFTFVVPGLWDVWDPKGKDVKVWLWSFAFTFTTGLWLWARNRNASALEPKGARPAKSRGSKK